jgi:hypothetical protein
VVIGTVVGILTGLFAALLLRLKVRFQDVAIDGILGAIAFPLTFVGVVLVPWKNTIVGDTLVTSTMKNYQHPDMVAYAVAILLPVLYELRRLKKRAQSKG